MLYYRYIFGALLLFLSYDVVFAQLAEIERAQNELAEVREELQRIGREKETRLFNDLKKAPPKKFINGIWVSSPEALEITGAIDILNKTEITPLTERRQKLIEEIKKLWASPETKKELKAQLKSFEFSIEKLEGQLERAQAYQKRLYSERDALISERGVMANDIKPIQAERDILKGGLKNLAETYPERLGLQKVMRSQIDMVADDLRAAQKVSRAIKISQGPVETGIAENNLRIELLKSMLESARATQATRPPIATPPARTAPRLLHPDVVGSAKPLLPALPVNVELQQLPPTQNPSQAIIRIPQRDAVNGRVFITRAEYQVLMNDWVAKVGSQKISAPKVGALRKLGGTFLQGIQYMPLPSEIINAVTGATDQDWIDVRNADIKNAKARIDVININIVDLERQRDAIPQNSVSKPIGVSMKGDNSRDNEKNRNILEKQIESLYKKRSENIDMIRLWQYHIQEKISNQINEEYNKMLNKKYVDRHFGPVY